MAKDTYTAEKLPEPNSEGGESVMYPVYTKKIGQGGVLDVHCARGVRGYEHVRGIHIGSSVLRANETCVTIRPISEHGNILQSCQIDIPNDPETLTGIAEALMRAAKRAGSRGKA